MQFETKIPIKRHLKKFIQHEMGKEDIVLGNTDMYGLLFSCFFTKNSSHIDEGQLKADRSRWTDIIIRFSFDDLRRKGFIVTYESVLLFNRIADKHFRGLLLNEIRLKQQLVQNFVMKDTIIAFLDHYGISEDDMKYDTIVKWVQRRFKNHRESYIKLQ